MRFCWDGDERPAPGGEVRVMGVEQSNSSVVLRRALRAEGLPPARGRAPTRSSRCCASSTRHGFPHIAPLEGSYTYRGAAARRDARRDAALHPARRRRLGARRRRARARAAATSSSRACTTSAPSPAGCTPCSPATPRTRDFAPEEPSEEHVALISATIDEQIERTFIELPELEALEPISRPRRGAARPPRRCSPSTASAGA